MEWIIILLNVLVTCIVTYFLIVRRLNLLHLLLDLVSEIEAKQEDCEITPGKSNDKRLEVLPDAKCLTYQCYTKRDKRWGKEYASKYTLIVLREDIKDIEKDKTIEHLKNK